MHRKYFCWSFDDGLEQDKKIIEILKEYGMGATFNLNSGLYGVKTFEGRIGNYGLKEVPAEGFNPAVFHLLPYVTHFRIPEDEVCQVYEGFEIASHTVHHVHLNKCSEEERRAEIQDDIKALSEKFSQQVTGFAYPYGQGDKYCTDILREAGVEHARILSTDTTFRFPEDPLRMPKTCWHIAENTFDTLNSFFQAVPEEDDMFFLMFAHGYEFDFYTKESNWDKFRRICDTVRRHDDIVCCSIRDALHQHNQ